MLVSTVGPFAKYGSVAVARRDRRGRRLHGLHGRAELHPPRLRGVRPARRARAAPRCSPPWATTGCRARWPARSPSRTPGRTPSRVDVGYFVRGASRQRRHQGVAGRRDARPGLRLPRRPHRDRARSGAGALLRRAAAGVLAPAAPSTSPCRSPTTACARSTPTSASGPLARGVQLVVPRDQPGPDACPGSRAVMQGAGERIVVAAARPQRHAGHLAADRNAPTAPTAARSRPPRSTGPIPTTSPRASWRGRPSAPPAPASRAPVRSPPLLAFGGLAGLHEGCAAAGIRERTAPVTA